MSKYCIEEKKKRCRADDHRDVCGYSVNITFLLYGGQWRFVNDSGPDSGQQGSASKL